MPFNQILSIFIEIIEFIKFIFKKNQRPNPVAILKHREQIRKDFNQKLPEKDKYGVHCEAIIRDLKRMDTYPEIEIANKGISPWFKVEIKGLYHKGVEAFISSPKYIKKDQNDQWIFTDYKDKDEKILAYPVGRIPFDLIGYINWEGDEYYPFPHIYCHFKAFKGQPYESIPFYGKYGNSEHLFEVEGFKPWDKKKGVWFLNLKK